MTCNVKPGNDVQIVIPALDCPRSVKSAVESLPISKWSGATYAGIFYSNKIRKGPSLSPL